MLVAQVGVLWGRIKVRGSAAHVMRANQAINAIEKTYLLIQAMRELEARLNNEKHPAFRLLDAAARDPWLKENPPEITFFGFQAEGTTVSFHDSPVIQTLSAAHQEVT